MLPLKALEEDPSLFIPILCGAVLSILWLVDAFLQLLSLSSRGILLWVCCLCPNFPFLTRTQIPGLW